ncbi:hypothetical protein CYMTET_12133, partial [Cymbomonas tetramitiformis]
MSDGVLETRNNKIQPNDTARKISRRKRYPIMSNQPRVLPYRYFHSQEMPSSLPTFSPTRKRRGNQQNDVRNWTAAAALLFTLAIFYWRYDAAQKVSNVVTRAKEHAPSKHAMAGTGVIEEKFRPVEAEVTVEVEEEEDESGEEAQEEVEQLTATRKAVPASTAAVSRSVPAYETVTTPEFVYGGTWDKSKRTASLSVDGAPTLACHATTLLHLPEGKVMMAWFGGTYEGAEDVGIWTSVRSKHGWSRPQEAAKVFRDAPYKGKNMKSNGPYNYAEPPRKGREPHWNPVLWCADGADGGDGAQNGPCTGKIILYFKIGWRIPEWETYVTSSENQGATWAAPQPLMKGDHGGRGPVKNKVIKLADGSWLAPASLENALGSRKRAWRAFVDRSVDGGLTWEKWPKDGELMPPSSEGHWGVIQPTLWESAPGKVHMMLRSSRGHKAPVWRADSEDGGKTWGKVYRTTLPNNNSGLDVARLPSGVLVLAYNPTTEERYPLQL